MKRETELMLESFFREHADMEYLRSGTERAVRKMAEVRLPNKIMTCGNGGSFSDAGHIVGELMKSFKRKRPLSENFAADEDLRARLEGAVPALCLGESSPLTTAIINDIGSGWMYAQQVFGLGCEGDVLIGLSTSGNAENVYNAVRAAKLKNVFTVGFTGEHGGKLNGVCDVLLNVPAAETYRVQELHLPLYHLICACVESERW